MVIYLEYCLPLYWLWNLFEELEPQKFFHYSNKKFDFGIYIESDCLYEQRFYIKTDSNDEVIHVMFIIVGDVTKNRALEWWIRW